MTKRFIVESVMIDCLCEDEPRIAKVITDTDENYSYEDLYEVVDLLNEQQDHISYWKHKVYGLLWILRQFDEEKVKELLKELEDE